LDNKPPLKTGDWVKVLHYDSYKGTTFASFPVLSCRLIFPRPSDGRRWILTYDLNGEHRSVIVGEDGVDKFHTISPI
jgi:hypothetical protein